MNVFARKDFIYMIKLTMLGKLRSFLKEWNVGVNSFGDNKLAGEFAMGGKIRMRVCLGVKYPGVILPWGEESGGELVMVGESS